MHDHTPRPAAVRARVVAIAIGALVLLTVAGPQASATPGGVDTSFGDGGRVRLDYGSNDDEAWKLLRQSDGRLLAIGFARGSGGAFDLAVARFTSQGVPDATFGTDGVAIVDISGGHDQGFGGAIQPDGKIVVAGEGSTGDGQRMIVMRLMPDGSLDDDFSGDGSVTIPRFSTTSQDSGADVLVRPGGGVIVGGSTRVGTNVAMALAGLDDAGELDPTFGGDGEVTFDINAGSNDRIDELTGGPADTIIAAGTSADVLAVARFEPDGDPDPTFSTDGYTTTDVGNPATGNGIGVQPGTGRIIVAGRAGYGAGSQDYVAAAYEADGGLDTTWGGGDGIVETSLGVGSDLACAVAFQADGSLLIGGDTYQGAATGYDFGIARYTPDGVLDPTFGRGGFQTTDFGDGDDFTYGLLVTPSGDIVQGGYSDFGGDIDVTMLRYDATTVAANPDALVRLGDLPDAAGDGVYNLTGHEQAVRMTLQRRSHASVELTFTNDGTDPDTMTITATAGTNRFGAIYRVNGTDRSGEVTGAGLDTGTLAPGDSISVMVRVKVTKAASRGAKRAFLATVTSDSTPARRDAVGFTIKAR